MRLPAGQQLGGFTIVAQIGRGAMGTVYRARQTALERDVALKALDNTHDEAAFARFRDEAIRVAKLSHPSILPVYDFGMQDDVAYIVMELAEGGTLAAHTGQPVSAEQAIRLLKPAAEALDYAHQANIIHRDVKPANLLFDGHGRLYLSDFGLALLRDATSSSTWGQVLGTPSYMAPEQFRSKAEPASDVYSLAVTLFQLLTGRVPYERENPLAVALAHLREDVPSARQLNPNVSSAVDAAVQRGMAKDPADRFPRALELLAAVYRALQQSSAARAAAPAPAARSQASAGAPAPTRPAVPAQPAMARPAAAMRSTAAPAAASTAANPFSPTEVLPARPAPAPGRVLFESKATPEWARANIVARNGRVGIQDDLIEITLTPAQVAQTMFPVGVLDEVWAELEFAAHPNSGAFDLMFHEGVGAQAHCLRIEPSNGQVSIGLVHSAGNGEERWLASRRVALEPGSRHSVLLVARKDAIEAFLDGSSILRAKDATVSRGMAHLRMQPRGTGSTFQLQRVAVYRPPG